MTVVDLTLTIPELFEGKRVFGLEERSHTGGGRAYTGMIYHFAHHGMVGTYIDLPGHIKETDDGADAAGYPAEKLFRVEATVIHLDRENGSGAVIADELQAACPQPFKGEALILNALGDRPREAVEFRSVWLGADARQWIIETGAHLLVSDIYESRAQEGVFLDFFEAGILTVCEPDNLHLLTAPYVRLTALPVRFSGVTQLPCRLLAEMDY